MNPVVICPFNRPDKLDLVLGNWFQQTKLIPLVLVCNQFGDWTQEAIDAGAIVITGQASIGGARNAGIEYAKSFNHDWVIMLDDDNFYGCGYVQQILNHIDDNVDILSQGITFTRFGNGDLHLFKPNMYFAPGHCTAFRTSKAVKFPEWNLGEDVRWSKDMLASGAKLKQLPPWHSIYNRGGSGHAFQASDIKFKKQFGPSYLIGNVPDSFVENPKDVSQYPLIEISNEDYYLEFKAKNQRRIVAGEIRL